MVAFLNEVQTNLRPFTCSGRQFYCERLEENRGYDITENGELVLAFEKNRFGFSVHNEFGKIGNLQDEGCYAYYRTANRDRTVHSSTVVDAIIGASKIEIRKMSDRNG